MIRRLAVLNCFLVLILAVIALGLDCLSVLEGGSPTALGLTVVSAPSVVILSLLAYLIVVRRPENVIGPGFSLVALMITITGLAEAYSHYGLDVSPGSLPAIATVVWVSEWTWVPALLPLLTFLFLICPDGRLPSARWRPVAFCVAATLTLLTLGTMFSPFETRSEVDNPYGFTALGGLPAIAMSIGYVGLIPSIGLSALAMVLRFRRSTGVERLQLKWFASASVAVLGLFLLSWIIADLTESEVIWSFWLGGAIALVVFATAIAVLRYRLYDIDRLINRTVVYALLTAMLGLLYFGLVVGLQAISQPLSGSSDLAIALTTLIVAALFLPARQRVQLLVDRRFNRRAYDAARTVEVFGARLRQNIDLDTLRYELLTVVDETMEPSRVSLWLRTETT